MQVTNIIALSQTHFESKCSTNEWTTTTTVLFSQLSRRLQTSILLHLSLQTPTRKENEKKKFKKKITEKKKKKDKIS